MKINLGFFKILCLLLMLENIGCVQGPPSIKVTQKEPPEFGGLPSWEITKSSLLGIRANDPVNSALNMEWYVEEYGDLWSLLMPEKQNLGAILKRYSVHDGGYEKDLCFDLQPLPPFEYLYQIALQNPDPRSDVNAWETCCGDPLPVYHTIHNEITPQWGNFGSGFYYDNPWFQPLDDCDYETPHAVKLDDTVCSYGPFVSDDIDDDRHACRPEIHPAQQLWFKDRTISDHTAYWLFFFQDQSDRFWDYDDVYLINCDDDCTVPEENQARIRPWARSPLYGQFQIAFQVYPYSTFSPQGDPLVIRLSVRARRENVTSEHPEMHTDVGTGTMNSLFLEDEELLRVEEPAAYDDDMGIQFVEVTKQSDGSYKGFIQISMVIGDGDDDSSISPFLTGDGTGLMVLHADIFPPKNLPPPIFSMR